MPDHPTYHRQVLDHLGLVAGMFDALGIGDPLDQATHHNPERRDLTVGEAVNARGLTGLGVLNQALSRGPRFFQHQPTYRLISPRVTPERLNDDALGRALETLYASGVTALYSLMAATAAKRLGLCPASAHRDTTSVQVDGRDNRAEEPEAQVVPITPGDSRAHRPDRNHVMLEWLVDHHAGSPVLMTPRSGHSRDAPEGRQVIRTHLEPWRTTSAATSLVADRALSSEANLATLAQTAMPWITRVPATLSDAQAILGSAKPPAMAPLVEGERDQALTSPSGGGAPRWVLIDSEPRPPQAQRRGDQPRRQQRDQASNALQQVCGTTLACEAEAPQALATFVQDLQVTFLTTKAVRATPRDGQRGRPRQGVPPDQGVYHSAGALAASRAARHARVDQHRCFIRATHALDARPLPPQELLAGDTGQVHAERGWRFLKDPQCLAASR